MSLIRQLSGTDVGPIGTNRGFDHRYAMGNPTQTRRGKFTNLQTDAPGMGVNNLLIENGDVRLLENGDALLLG